LFSVFSLHPCPLLQVLLNFNELQIRALTMLTADGSMHLTP
jgi:hypothetical protein